MIRQVSDYHEMSRRMRSMYGNKVNDIQLIPWPVIRNSTTARYHLLGRPDPEFQFDVERFLIPPSLGYLGESGLPRLKATSHMPELQSTKMKFLLKARNVLISHHGTMYHEDMGLTVLGYGCRQDEIGGIPYSPRKAVDKVLVMSQFWGYGPFHFLIECLPRMMTVMHLLRDPSVKIHVNLIHHFHYGTYDEDVSRSVKTVYKWLGIPKERLIWGNIYAKVAYYPQQTACLHASPMEIRHFSTVLQHEMRRRFTVMHGHPSMHQQYNSSSILVSSSSIASSTSPNKTAKTFNQDKNMSVNEKKKKSVLDDLPNKDNTEDTVKNLLPLNTPVDAGKGDILFIRRSVKGTLQGSRHILEFDELVAGVMKKFPNRTYTIYKDNPSPSFQDTLVMFHNADIVISPHGAGMSNTLTSRRGTRVFEIKSNDWYPGNCYQVLFYYLGLNFWGFGPKINHREKYYSITNDEIEKIATMVKQMWDDPSIRVNDWTSQ